MKIENRFGSIILEGKDEAIVRECILGNARVAKELMLSLVVKKDLSTPLANLADFIGPNGTLPADWMRDTLLQMAFLDPSMPRPLMKQGHIYTRRIGDIRITMRYDLNSDIPETGEKYSIRFTSEESLAKKRRFGTVVKRFNTEDEAIKEYFNAKEYMHMILEE